MAARLCTCGVLSNGSAAKVCGILDLESKITSGNYRRVSYFSRKRFYSILPVMKPYFQSQVYMPFLLAVVKRATAASCATTLTASYPAPIVSDGWTAQLIVQNLNQPRSILFDSNGGLLIVQAGAGIVHLELTDHGTTCLEVSKKTFLINSTAVSHLNYLFAK